MQNLTYFGISACVIALIAIAFLLGYSEGYKQGENEGYREAIDDYNNRRRMK